MKIFVFCLLCTGVVSLFEGDSCVMQDANLGGGQCVRINNCFYAKNFAGNNSTAQLCGLRKKQLLVCCPHHHERSNQHSSIRISIKKCNEYHQKRLNVGITGGTKAKLQEFPHMAAIGYGLTDVKWLCGGTLISDQFILTAAHCTLSKNFGSPTWIRLGELDFNDTSDHSIDLKIGNIYRNPDYKSSLFYNDLALLKLKKKVKITYQILPACLYTKKHIFHKRVQAIGWGKTDYLNELGSPHLLKTDLNMIKYSKCSRRHPISRKLSNGLDKKTQICAGDSTGKDTCQGDSGGPLQFLDRSSRNPIFFIIGITSFGKACGVADSYGVYTKISSYLPWIESIVWKSK